MKSIGIFLFSLFSIASAQVSETLIALTDKYLYQITIQAFEALRNATDPDTLDWCSDGCSYSSTVFPWNFLPSCHRHDFGCKNYSIQERYTQENKDKLDLKLKSDLYDACETENDPSAVEACKVDADYYYSQVQLGIRVIPDGPDADGLE